MKKLIYILLLTLTSCGYGGMNNSKPIIINEIESIYGTNFCYYYGEGISRSNGLTSYTFAFVDTMGKFNIGDTINLVKFHHIKQ